MDDNLLGHYLIHYRARKDYSNIARKLAEEDWANITLSDDEEDTMDQTSPASAKKTQQTQKKKKKERYYSNQVRFCLTINS